MNRVKLRLSEMSSVRAVGFTLVELMVALVLTIFLAGTAILMHLSGRSAFIESEQLSRIQENVRFASDYVIRDVRNAGFRDETFLRTGHETQIRQAYADVLDDGATLRIRYAGRGHCTQAFDEFRLVENEYSFDAGSGELRCRGRAIPRDDPGSMLITDQDFSEAVGLVSGLTGLAFQKVCPDGGTECACDLVTDFEGSCIGVRVALQVEGMMEIGNSGVFENRAVELTAAFRNIILERVNAAASL